MRGKQISAVLNRISCTIHGDSGPGIFRGSCFGKPFLNSTQLGVQLFGDQVVLIPELNDPAIGNASHHQTSWPAPVRGQDGFPDDQNGQVIRFHLFQYLLGCGGPPQTPRSRRGQKEHHSCVRGGSVELIYKRAVAPYTYERRLPLRRDCRPQEVPGKCEYESEAENPNQPFALRHLECSA